jgi:large subunit ribosomal protein L29
MNINELRELSGSELSERRRELREEFLHLRLKQQSGQLEKPSQLRLIRREIARIETVSTLGHVVQTNRTKLS